MRALVGLAVLGAALFWATRAQARQVNRLAPLIEGGADELEFEGEPMPEPYDPGPVYDPRDARARRGNTLAFLASIAVFESEPGADGYRRLFVLEGAPQYFYSFDDHPALLGWPGVPLPDEWCTRAGLPPGCVSTAAGRYQITRTTWNRLRGKLGRAELPDFSPASQDRAALELIDEKGALGLVEAGHFDDAIARVRKVWASMPAADYGQGEKSLERWRQAYADAGGAFA